MDLKTAFEKVKAKGVKETVKYCVQKLRQNKEKEGDIFTILLLTNRDSDNIGDQVIEACDIGILSAVMKNLNVNTLSYRIVSREASIISQKYLSTKDPELLKTARRLIEKADVVIFGGAPMFNYLYQSFYERTAVTLELAEEYHTPVLFSAVGIEGYEEDNPKCQRLKKALNLDCVRQVTTRDDFVSLQKYKENEQMVIGKVSDPAVFSSKVFEKFISKKPKKKKKIGLFILRANGFVDNKINFTREEAASFWIDLMHEFEERGYDYELVTSGHFGDEAFVDYLIRYYGVNQDKCVFNMNTPDFLLRKISSYHAIISCRLHPSIIAFSLGVPSLGIVWNTKVRGFYESIGYENRVVETEGMNAKDVADRVECAIEEGTDRNEEYMTSVYRTLFEAQKKLVYPNGSDIQLFSYEQIIKNIPVCQETTHAEYEEKIKRKFRRVYKTCNERFDKNIKYQKTIDAMKAGQAD